MDNKSKLMEFKRSRLERKAEDQMTRKTILLGVVTLGTLILIIAFGVPLLVRFSLLLGEAKNLGAKDKTVEKQLPPLPPRLFVAFEATNSATIEISGLAEAGTEAELKKEDVTVAKTKVNEAGEFKFDQVNLEEGKNTFNARVISEKSGSSDLSKDLEIVFDNRPPELTLSNPSEDAVTVDFVDYDVIGKSEKGVSVLVNDRVARVDDEGGFKLKVQLAAGKNEIEVVARDLAGNETRKKVTITYDI
jgi:hypothetical protein